MDLSALDSQTCEGANSIFGRGSASELEQAAPPGASQRALKLLRDRPARSRGRASVHGGGSQ